MTRAAAELAQQEAEVEVDRYFTSIGQSSKTLEFFIIEADDARSALGQISGAPLPPDAPEGSPG